MRIQFSKMHSLGNDFMVIDLVTQRMLLHPELIRRLAHRNFGVGFDQLIIAEPPERPDADFKYRIFNADGSEIEHYGNGIRCFSRFVHERHLTRKNKIRVQTMGGILEPEINAQGWVRVGTAEPQFLPEQIPFISDEAKPSYLIDVLDQTVELDVVNIGAPYAVLLVKDIHGAPVVTLGSALAAHPCFPEQVNAGFMQLVNRGEIYLRVFERGLGETPACGAAACAAVISGIRRGLLDAKVKVQLAGGAVLVHWQPGETVWIAGPTATTFEGSFNPYDFYVPEPTEASQY